jgi:hypothetical protein
VLRLLKYESGCTRAVPCIAPVGTALSSWWPRRPVLYPLSYEGNPPIVGDVKVPRGRFRAVRSLHASRLDRHKPTVLLRRCTLSLFDLGA